MTSASFVIALPSALEAQCVPSQAYFSGVADDALTIWINGTQLNTASMPITYVDWTSTTPSPVYTFPVGILNTSGPNTIDAENQNTTASIVLSAWWIDIVCADGNHTYITNDDGGYKMYDDITGSNPPPVYSGNQWYQPNWSDTGNLFSGTPQLVSTTYGNGNGYTLKNLWNPATGAILSPISWDNSGVDHSASEKIYYTKTFTLTDPGEPPPSSTLTKTANVSASLTYAQTVTYTLKVCNNGGPISGPVTLVDTHDSHLALAVWPNSSTYGGSFPFAYSGGSPLTIIYQTGFGGYGTCDTITYGLYAEGSPCSILNNAVTLKTLTTEGAPVSANTSYAVTMACPPTATFTSTKTNTETETGTPTRTMTSTFTVPSTKTSTSTTSPTGTSSATSTPTLSHTPTETSSVSSTQTDSPTVPGTSTMTPTVTATTTSSASSTPTNASTATLTQTASPSETSTEARTNTSTSTMVDTYTLTPTQTPTETQPDTATATVTQTSTWTLVDTATTTFSPVFTATATATTVSTSTGTVTGTATATFADTATVTSTNSATSTATNASTATSTYTTTWTNTPVWTWTPSSTPTSDGDHFVSKNVFYPNAPVTIHMQLKVAAGPYSLTIFNSAGEHIKTLGNGKAEETGYDKIFTWDGTNKYGDLCASGIYVIYLSGPLEVRKARVIFLK